MTNMTTMPIYGKNLKNLLWDQTADDLESWCAASRIRVLSNLFKWWLLVTQIQQFPTSFAQKPLGRLKPHFIWSLCGMWWNEGLFKCSRSHNHVRIWWKTCSSEPGGRLPWILVYNIGYSSTTNVFIWWPWVELDYFYDRVRFVFECFCMDESLYCIEC